MKCAMCGRLERLQKLAASAAAVNDPANMRMVLQTIADSLRNVVDSPPESDSRLLFAAMNAYDLELDTKKPTFVNRTEAMGAAVRAVIRGVHDGV